MLPTKLVSGGAFPALTWPSVQGGPLDLATIGGWRMLVVYRGRHCPICKTYLGTLNTLLPKFADLGVSVSALSADTLAKAEVDVAEHKWQFPVGYDLAPDQMRALGLYVSAPSSPQETDRPFAEPGLFVINPEDQLQIIDVSNAPFSRPDLRSMLGGLSYVIANNYPVRGQA